MTGTLNFLPLASVLAILLLTPRAVLSAQAKDAMREPSVTAESGQRYAIEASTRTIDLAEAKKIYDGGRSIFVDARSAAAYQTRHIKGALNCPVGDLGTKAEDFERSYPPETAVVVYCGGESCKLSFKVAARLFERGHFKRVLVFAGGWKEWVQAGFPTEP